MLLKIADWFLSLQRVTKNTWPIFWWRMEKLRL